MCPEEKVTRLAVIVALVLAGLCAAETPAGDLLATIPGLLVEARVCAEYVCIKI